MAMNENLSEFSNPMAPQRKTLPTSLHPLHETALRIADLGFNRSRAKTKDLVALLLCHGARAWRYSQPEANIHLYVARRSGRAPIVLRLR